MVMVVVVVVGFSVDGIVAGGGVIVVCGSASSGPGDKNTANNVTLRYKWILYNL